jgi:hypothetical protein
MSLWPASGRRHPEAVPQLLFCEQSILIRVSQRPPVSMILSIGALKCLFRRPSQPQKHGFTLRFKRCLELRHRKWAAAGNFWQARIPIIESLTQVVCRASRGLAQPIQHGTPNDANNARRSEGSWPHALLHCCLTACFAENKDALRLKTRPAARATHLQNS